MHIGLGLVVLTCVSAAGAQPALSLRFDNGQSEITVAPGSQVRVHVWATGLPATGTPVPWTTPPGTGQVGQYAGFLSVLFDLRATSGSWSSGTWVPPFPTPDPFPPHASGSNFNGINVGVGFGPPVTPPEFQLWYATLTIGSADVQLSTLIQPVGNPAQTGLEVGLAGILPGLNVSQWLTALNGAAVIHVPAPSGVVVLAAGLVVARRRRRRE